MKCFRLLATVLDEVWAEMPGTEKEKIAEVKRRADYLSGQYARLTTVENNIDYSDPATRYIYLCRYVTSHANIVAKLIAQEPALHALFDKDRVHVSCIGGGPGSDLLGVLKHLDESEQVPSLKFFLFDREAAWGESWSDVDDKLDRKISAYFQPFDVTSAPTRQHGTKYLNADLFTMIYFASEVYYVRDQAVPFFRHMFDNAKKGALFLYVDNASSHFFDWFDEQVQGCGLEVISSMNDATEWLPGDEDKADLREHFQRMPGYPKLKANVAYRILKKT